MNNIKRIQEALAEKDCDAMLVSSPVNRFFATGFSSSAGMLLVTAKDAWFFIDGRYIEAARAAVSGVAHVELISAGQSYIARLNAVFESAGITSVGFEDGIVTYAEYHEWEEKLTAKLCPMQKMMQLLRAVKSEDDLNKMKKAQQISEKAFLETLPLISANITEKELATELVYRMVKNGADDKSFSPIVVSGTKSSMPHGVPGDVKIGPGFLTIDFGARLDGWCSDTTRTLSVGQPTDEMVKVYDTVLKAQEAGISAARAGVLCRDIDAAARAVIENAGYGEYFDHGLGHGIGLEVHEWPRTAPGQDYPIPAGAVVSSEPGIYLPGKFGVRIEDLIYITQTGTINITSLTKELTVVG